MKIVRRADFNDDCPYEREFAGIRKFEPISRSHEGFVDLLQVGRNDTEGYFYYVMELADGVSGSSFALAEPAEIDASYHLLNQALGRVKRQAKPEHYAIYHLSVVEEQPIAQVCGALGVSAAAAYLAKHRVGALVKKELRRLREMEI